MFKRVPVTLLLLVLSIAFAVLISISDAEKLERDLRAQHLKAGDFELLHNNRPFSTMQLRGKPVILYFGYTFCPDVCPVGLSRIREVLLSDETFKDVPALFVTVDPLRDSAERLKEYTSFFHPNIVGLRGDEKKIKSISAAYGTFYRSARDESVNSSEYTVDHSAYFYLLDKSGVLVRVLDHDATVQEISELLHKLM